MKTKVLTLFAITISALTYMSCNSKNGGEQQNVEEQEVSFTETLTSEDSTQMLKIADDCMKLLQERKYDEAIGMLYVYDDSTKVLESISSDMASSLRRRFKVFPVLKYERDYFTFMEQGANDVRYKVWFAEEEHPEINGEAVMNLMFNPVKVDGSWYLCLKDYGQKFNENKR